MLGDSKVGVIWPDRLMDQIAEATGAHNFALPYGVAGATIQSAKDSIDAILAGLNPSQDPVHVLCNWGINDINPLPNQATWEANYTYILDAIHTKWPSAQAWLPRVWKVGEMVNANTMAGWIANVQAARSTFAHLGHDERVWLEGGDNGATMTSDGGHYSDAGQTECARQWGTVLGYF